MIVATVAGLAVWAIEEALYSELFVVRNLEVAYLSEPTLPSGLPFEPVQKAAIQELSGVKLESQNLTAIDLRQVEANLRSNAWLRTIQIRKIFPSTLRIEVDFRIPIAIVQERDEPLFYLDQDYETKVPVQPEIVGNLPLVHLQSQPVEKRGVYKEIGEILANWRQTGLHSLGEISGFQWSEPKGLQALLLYKIPNSREPARTWLEIGQFYGSQLFDDLVRLSRVLNYLTVNSITASQIFLAGNKKIVVKTARRS